MMRIDNKAPGSHQTRQIRLERAWWIALGAAVVIFSTVPVVNYLLGLSTKDYGLWYQVGKALRSGIDVYPRPESGRLFPFMYPPSAAAMLGFLSYLGPLGTLVALVVTTSCSWLACILFSVSLVSRPGERVRPLVLIVPTLSVVVLIYNIYLLGQPNLLLLAIVLGSFVALRAGREFACGALVATAAAIKAFPILVIGYLIYRRMWKATAATVLVLAGWLLIAPLAFRTPSQAVDDLVVWSKGMLFTYNAHSMAQRPLRSYSYKNQSIMAVAHRLLRDVPADGESVLSRRAKAASAGVRPEKGLPPLDASADLGLFGKPRATASFPLTKASQLPGAPPKSPTTGDASDQPVRWDNDLQSADAELRSAWRVNFANLEFRTVTAVTLSAILLISLFVVAVMPSRSRRTPESDAIEFALVILLTVMFSPLSFNYAYVWLLYPVTLAIHRVLNEPSNAPWRRLKRAWLGSILLIPALAIAMPQVAQAYGNLFVPSLLLVIGLGLMPRTLPQPIDIGKPHTLALPFSSLWPRMPLPLGEASRAKERGG